MVIVIILNTYANRQRRRQYLLGVVKRFGDSVSPNRQLTLNITSELNNWR